MNKRRPVNLDLTSMKFPPMAIASILHRISGVVIFLFLPFLLYHLDQSLTSEATFLSSVIFLNLGYGKFLLWACLSAVVYHLFAGIRHLLMDFGIGETLQGARQSAIATILISVVVSILIGLWLW